MPRGLLDKRDRAAQVLYVGKAKNLRKRQSDQKQKEGRSDSSTPTIIGGTGFLAKGLLSIQLRI
jgi:hypothetical protein